jgi:hypothetical protein
MLDCGEIFLVEIIVPDGPEQPAASKNKTIKVYF